MVEVHRWHFSYLGTWRIISGKTSQVINSFHPTKKFTVEHSKKTISSLDVKTWNW